MDKEKYYTRSNGEKIKMKDMNTTHLSNALGKRYTKVFETNSVEEYNNAINEINDIREEINNRIGVWYKDKFENGGK